MVFAIGGREIQLVGVYKYVDVELSLIIRHEFVLQVYRYIKVPTSQG